MIKDKNIKWWIGVVSCTILFSIIIVFSYMKMSFLWNGINIIAKIERNGDSPMAMINGKAQNATFISINGREIFIDKDGSFSESIALIPGLSVVTINAEDKFGKSKEKKFEMIYKESAPSVAYNTNTTPIHE